MTAMAELSVYHQRVVEQAQQRVDELRAKKTTEMSEGELLMWLTRMEVATRNLLNVVTLLRLDAALKGVRQ